MPVSFEMHTPSTGHKEKDVPTEYVRISRLPPPPPPEEVTMRKATDEDKAAYPREYAEFKKMAPVAEVPVAMPAAKPAPAEAPVESMPAFDTEKTVSHVKPHKKG